eukprot:CAMPEP_0204843982 /NCGR_PEP_ID=MMETSP1346-20131115/48294_1 /ASSEMBLY_ACC=CAM_ASM_000771 /TAXON_ID=215587 /ORGANISM="Aplanochytrium stocchinoi, Strain GSBS06" /LENGTH=852 /DNA_ID=CAMNT_0051983209 /DNA_START=114 /DNA_END=2673 /DNA_ORIENTATION=-
MGASASVAAHAPEPTDETRPVYPDPSKGPFWTADPKGTKPIFASPKGPGSLEEVVPTTLIAAFKKAVDNWPNEIALAVERPLPPLVGKDFPPAFKDEEWKKWTYKEYYEDSEKVAKAMIKAGMVKSDSVNIFGFNSPEWFMSQLGAIMVGGRAAGIYPSDTPAQFQFKSDHSNGAVATVDSKKNFDKVKSQIDKLPYLKAIVAWEFQPPSDVKRSDGSTVKCYSWEDFLKSGESVSDEELQKLIDAQKPEECCCLIYTSGTTGNPKAVMISHDALIFEAHTVVVHGIPSFGLGGQERILSYLPLSHVAGMMVDIVSPIMCTAYKKAYTTVYFARPYDLKAGAIGDRLKFVKPTLFLGVPAFGCLIYTSGTTGNPKAVMISHDALIFEAHTVVVHGIPSFGLGGQERILSYLPLSHVAGMMVDIVSPIMCTAYKKAYTTVYFARPYDLKAGAIGDRLKFVKPTLFLGVPRVWEKIMEKLKAVGAQTTGLKKKLSTWAKAQGMSHLKECQLGGTGYKSYSYMLASKLILGKIKAALGLDECKFAMTGAAPITVECLEYFAALGININEVYGMSENTGAASWSTDECHLWGSCGYTMPGTEVKVFRQTGATINEKVEAPRCESKAAATEEQQGEICFRGRHVMMGYMANPRLGAAHVKEIEAKNAGTIDNEGWLHSGDKGTMTKTGMLHITGRYKEIIITAGGENVAPVPIEDSVKKLCGAVSNIIMIGDKRKFNVCLITLKAKGATGELPGGNDLDGGALLVNPDVTTVSGAMDDPTMIETIIKAIKATNADGSCCPSNASKIQKFTILPKDISVETGDLTATLKLKRSVVQEKYAKQIEAMYASKETYVKYQE